MGSGFPPVPLTINKRYNKLSKGDLTMKRTMNWETDLNQALKRAKEDNKSILLDFFNPK